MSRVGRVRVGVVVAVFVAPLLAVVVGVEPASADPAPSVPGTVRAVEPTRVLDTRSGVGAAARAVPAGGSVTVRVTGLGAVPATGVGAVFATLTVTQPRNSGYLSARPAGSDAGATSSLNFVAGQTVANSVFVPVGAGGQITVANVSAGSSQVIVDVTAFTVAGPAVEPGAFVALAPGRLLDTRVGTGSVKAPVGAGASIVVDTLGAAGLPLAGIGAVVLDVVATRTTGSGNLVLSSAETSAGSSSNLNWTRTGQTVADQVQTRVDPSGRIRVTNRGSAPVDVVADVEGYVVAGRPITADSVAVVDARRIADTRGGYGGPVGHDGPRAFFIGGVSSVLPPFHSPNGYPVAALVLTVTVTRTTGSGYLTVWSGQGAAPVASTANWSGAGQTVASLVVVPVTVPLHQSFTVAVTGGTADVVSDLSGYVLLDASAAPPPVPVEATGAQQGPSHDGHAAGSLPSGATRRWDVDFAAVTGHPADSVYVGRPVVTSDGTSYVTVHFYDDHTGDAGNAFYSITPDGEVSGRSLDTLGGVDLELADDRLITVDDTGLVTSSPLEGGSGADWGRVLYFSGAHVLGPAAYGNRVFLATQTTLWALDVDNGNIVWQVTLPDGASDPAVAADATGVYVTGSLGEPSVAYTLDGVLRWTNIHSTGGGAGTPALHDGRFWARTDNGTSGSVFDADTGTFLRRFDGDRPVAFAQGLAITAAGPGLEALSETDGSVVWTSGGDGTDLVGTPITTDDTVYMGASDGTVRGYAVATGRQTWSAATPAVPYGSLGWQTGPAIGGGLLLVPNQSHLTAFG